MNSSAILSRAGKFWAISADGLADLQQRVVGGPDAFDDVIPGRPRAERGGKIAVLPLRGVLTPHRCFFSGTALDSFTETLRTAFFNSSVHTIVLDIDSPGGSVSGVQELADTIRGYKALKPIYAVANHEAASAAYWIAASCSRVYSSPSGEVGSIGVWCMHQNVSRMLDKAGVDVSLIHAGKHKVEGNPFEPLGDDARAEMQRSVDYAYGKFIDAVSRGRNVSAKTVRDTYGGGRMFESDRAKNLGMIDGVATLSDVVMGIDGVSRRQKIMSRLTFAELDAMLNDVN